MPHQSHITPIIKITLIIKIIVYLFPLSAQTPGKTFQYPIIVTDPDSIPYFENRYVRITGPVADVKEVMFPEGVTGYLNMFRNYPDNPFDVTISRKSMGFFIPLEQYKGRRIQLTGKVVSFVQKKTGVKKYSIRLTRPKQIVFNDE